MEKAAHKVLRKDCYEATRILARGVYLASGFDNASLKSEGGNNFPRCVFT